MDQTSVMIGQNVCFKCNAGLDATPNAESASFKYQWLKNGGPITDTNRYLGIMSEVTGNLTILRVNISVEGNYSCNVTSENYPNISALSQEAVLDVGKPVENVRLLLD